MQKFKNIVVGISGGVDSAVSALLLKQKGYNVHGAFMQNWDIVDETGKCDQDITYAEASKICDHLEIPLTRIHFVKEYWNSIFMKFLDDYRAGATPNPDILCNRYIKFDHFFTYAINNLQADAIATGHYANTSFGPYLEQYQSSRNNKLLVPTDTFKDQTFFLSQIQQKALQRTMFPLAHLTKEQVKDIARQNGLAFVANKKESTGICFIGDRKFEQFIEEYIEDVSGDFVDIDTFNVVGQHNGQHKLTLGQRASIRGQARPYFVVRKDVSKNIIYVGFGNKHPALMTRFIRTNTPHWIDEVPTELARCGTLKCRVQYRHQKGRVNCTVAQIEDGLIIYLHKNKRAITPGQFAVFYKDDQCLGGAKIVQGFVSKYILKHNPLEVSQCETVCKSDIVN